MSEDTQKFVDIEILGQSRKCLVLERKARSSDAVITSYIPTFEDGESIVEWLVKLFGGSAEKVKAAIIRDIIKPAAIEATSAAMTTDAAGNVEFSPLKYVEALAAWGEPASRRAGGPSLADLRERLAQISPRFLQLIGLMRENPAGFANSPEGMEFGKLYLEQKEINDAIAAKEGAPKKPRKPRAKKEKVAEAPAPEVAG